MLNLKSVRYPVTLEPEEMQELFDLLHEVKTQVAGHGLVGSYEKVRRALAIVAACKKNEKEVEY